MSKFIAQELADFYQKVADGGEIMVGAKGSVLISDIAGPDLISDKEYWHIKPENKIIDMGHFIKSGIDMEFSNNGGKWGVGILVALLVDGEDCPGHIYMKDHTDCNTRPLRYCRPRMNHIHYWGGGECPLPEGFTLQLYFRDGVSMVADDIHEGYNWLHCDTSSDIIGYKILRKADGWVYPWEQELEK